MEGRWGMAAVQAQDVRLPRGNSLAHVLGCYLHTLGPPTFAFLWAQGATWLV